MITEDNFWEQCDVNDLWIYDKLILSRKLGYTCGPVGVDVPKPDNYIVRPITNILGMGRGAEIVFIENDTEHLSLGYFWCEVFEGQHLSVDYFNGEQFLCVEGTRDHIEPLFKWKKWKRVNDNIPFPSILPIYPYMNCEFIGNKLIEVHVRKNPNFDHGGDIIYPVWKGQDTTPPQGMKYVEAPEYKRAGFFILDK